MKKFIFILFLITAIYNLFLVIKIYFSKEDITCKVYKKKYYIISLLFFFLLAILKFEAIKNSS